MLNLSAGPELRPSPVYGKEAGHSETYTVGVPQVGGRGSQVQLFSATQSTTKKKLVSSGQGFGTPSKESVAMAKGLYISQALAAATIALTLSAIGGIVTMVIVYNIQTEYLNMTASPTDPTTTLFPTGPQPEMRLPGDLMPDRYKLYIRVHLYTRIIDDANVNITSPNQTFAFDGNSTVHFRCVRSTKTIFLHSKDLLLSQRRVTNRDTNEEIVVSHVKHHEDESDFLEIQLDEVLREGGNYSLFTAFLGEMMDDLSGLYVSRYNEGVAAYGDNTERFLAITQMQPTDARKVFPCFDEPAMKAVFDVTIIHRRDTTALGNWEMDDSSVIDDWTYTRFFPTKKMSTYLLAFSVSEFVSPKESVVGEEVKIQIQTYARPEAIREGHADYADSITGKILLFYADKFDIKYDQKKLAQIAVPDFGAGAMENWGLVTYRETALLYEEGVSSTTDKEWIANIIAHELAHQWFGNLVTMRWWNDVWLNEGFASFMSHKAVNAVEPHWNIMDLAAVRDLQAAFEWDCLASSHPLSPPQATTQTPSEITEMFDVITYSKGAAVLRMLADHITDATFYAGVKNYLRAFAYSNTIPKDLWEYLQKAEYENGNINITALMNTWTTQIGYPVVTINTTDGAVSQKHFLYNRTAESRLVWHVPVRIMTQRAGTSKFVLTETTAVKDQLISKGGKWILANVNTTGYFRVNYDPSNWRRLLAQLDDNHLLIPVINRGQIVDDTFNLARAKLVNVTLALNSTRFLRKETALIPWESVIRNLHYFFQMFDRSAVYGPMQAYQRKQVTGLYTFFKNYTDNSTIPSDHSLQHNQLNAINIACYNGLEDCQAMVKLQFQTWIDNETINSIQPNLRNSIYCQAVAVGGEEEWEFAWRMFKQATIPAEKDNLRSALACTKKIWLLNRYLDYTLNPEKIRKMDAVSSIISVAHNVAGQDLAWNFVRAHWTYISKEYGGGVMPLGLLIDRVTERFSTEFELQELKRFQMEYDEEDLGSASRALEQAIERTEANIQWVQENKQTVLDWFRQEATS